jgi:hypothetical protein
MHLRDAHSNGDLTVPQRRKHAADPTAAASAGPGNRRLASARGRARRGLAALAVSGLLGLAGVVAGSAVAASAVQDDTGSSSSGGFSLSRRPGLAHA